MGTGSDHRKVWWGVVPDLGPYLENNFVSFGRKIKVNIDLETGESHAHAYSIVVNRRPNPLVSAGFRFDPRFSSIFLLALRPC
jgi:hypothetical protein